MTARWERAMRDDGSVMQQAIDVAARARRRSAPNPWVGCVIVRDGVVVGEGATQPPGSAHAEIEALRAAGDAARGATAYVTLEPCSFEGRTGACAGALIAAGVTRVVATFEDPDPRVSGAGFAQLRAAGVEVTVGPGADAVRRQLTPYLHHRRTGRPYVVAKIATSLDGKIAAADGTSQWITSDAARRDAHELRADAQAIVIGSGTALADRPALTVRDVAPAPDAPPWRVLLDARGRVPATGPLFATELAPTLVVTTDAAPAAAVDAWSAAGAKVATIAAGHDGGVDLDETIALLGREGALEVLIEGGGAVLGAVLAGGHAQRLVTYTAPVLLGERGRAGYALAGPDTLAAADRYALVEARAIGPDVRAVYEAEVS
jgi:diaminohydroxyphosphoribosylaminopyrimidine deaminase/5-amino-6-(5-phosphoribosylamino)uracil reductase